MSEETNGQAGEKIADLPCRYCDGDGRRPFKTDKDTLVIKSRHGDPCTMCSGRGVIRLKFPDTPTNCGPCQGTGRAQLMELYGSSYLDKGTCKPCATCNGTGYLSMAGLVRIWRNDKWNLR